MPLVIISEKAGIKKQYKAGEGLSQHAVIYLSDADYVNEVDDTHRAQMVGVAEGIASGGVASGDPVRVVGFGVVSGVICAAAVSPGDRVTGTEMTSGAGLASGKGKITPINTISPVIDLISGTLANGGVGVDDTALSLTSGVLSGVTGVRAWNTGEVLGKILTSGGVGSGVQLLVTLRG